MKALVNVGNGSIEVQDVPDPELRRPTDLLVKITNTTICGSDVHIVQGHMPTETPHVLGHEYVGVVEEVGSAVTRFRKGDRVVGPPMPFCRVCDHCRMGKIHLCTNTGIFGTGRTMGNLGGAHAEYLAVPFADANLCRVPDSVSDEQALLVGDVLTTGFYGLKNPGLRHGESVAVIGAGPIGLCAVHAAPLFGAGKIIAIGRHANRLEMAKKLGATHLVDEARGNVVERVRELTNGRGPDLVVDAAGTNGTIAQAFEMVAQVGRISVLAAVLAPTEVPMGHLFFKCLTMYGGLGDLSMMQVVMNLVEAGKLDASPLITHRRPFSEIVDAYELFSGRKDGVIKVLVKM